MEATGNDSNGAGIGGSDFVTYLCPNCGTTIKWPSFYCASPNTICKCGEPEFVTQMVVVWPLSVGEGITS